MAQSHNAFFSVSPHPTVFIVNVIHAWEGRQDDKFRVIQDIVRYVAKPQQGFLWSTLSKSTDGQTVVNVEAISGVGDVDKFFSDSVFAGKFGELRAVSDFEFHTYKVDDLILPEPAAGGVK